MFFGVINSILKFDRDPNFLVKNGVFYGDFLQSNGMFGQIFLPAIFWCKSGKFAILTQTFPLTFRFVIGTPFALSQQGEGWGGRKSA